MTDLIAFATAVVIVGAVAATARRRRGSGIPGWQVVRVTYPRAAKPDQLVAFVRSLSGLLAPWWRRWLLGSPAVVLETTAGSGGIAHYLRLPAGSAGYVLSQLRAALPGVRIEAAEQASATTTLALELRTSSRVHALRTDDLAHSAAAVLASLQPLRAGERALIQLIVSPAPPTAAPEVVTLEDRRLSWAALLSGRRPEPLRLPAELLRSRRDKRAELQCLAAIRLGVQTEDPARARQLIRQLLGPFHLASAPAASFRRRWLPSWWVARSIAGAKVPSGSWACLLNATELAAFAGVPIGERRLPGLTLGASPQLAPASDIPQSGRLLGQATFPGAERPLAISTAGSLRHLHVIGPTGVGKSTLLLNLICGDLAAGRGVIVIDPKGDLVADVLDRLPEARRDDVIVLDPTDAAWPVGFNLLQGSGGAPELAADQVVSLFRGLYGAFWGPRTDDILRAALLTLSRRPGMTLAEVPLLLIDERFRRRLTGGLDDYVLEGFWGWYEALSPGERAQAIGPVLNKLRTFLLRRRLRNVIGQSESTFSLAGVLTGGRVLLVSLAKGVLGEDAARLLGSAVLAQLWQAVQARAALPVDARRPVFCFVDEFQDYVGLPTSFSDLLAQARAYGFSLTLAHQHLGQLPPELRAAVLANARSRVIFQTSHADAAILARELGPDVAADDLAALAPFEAVAQIAAGDRTAPPVSLRTAAVPPPAGTAAQVRQASRARYGRDAAAVEAELRARAEGQAPTGALRRQRRRP